MGCVVADTHALVWYLFESSRLSSVALAALESVASAGDIVYVSAISVIEVAYLIEKGRLPECHWRVLNEVLADPDCNLRLVPVDSAVARAIRRIPREAIPDLPDRIIAATALELGLPLVTRDRELRRLGQIEIVW